MVQLCLEEHPVPFRTLLHLGILPPLLILVHSPLHPFHGSGPAGLPAPSPALSSPP